MNDDLNPEDRHVFSVLGRRTQELEWELLNSSEIQFAVKVIRVKSGDSLLLLDGEGWVAEAIVADVSAKNVVLEVQKESFDKKVSPKILLLGALDHGKIEKLLPALSELGVGELWIFSGSKDARNRLGEKKLLRWNEIALSSIKQCKRPRKMEIHIFSSLKEALGELVNRVEPQRCGLLDMSGELSQHDWLGLVEESSGSNALIVGPESGVSLEERAHAREEFKIRSISISQNVLQATTAAHVAAFLLGCSQ